MSATFAVGSNDIRWTQGSAGAVGTGAFTLMILAQPGVGNNNAGFIGAYATNTLVRGVGESSLHMYGPNDFSANGVGTLTQGTWYVLAVSKSGSSAPWNMHYRPVGGSWTHGTATGAANQGNGSAITNFRIGSMGVAQANGSIAAWAAWTSELTNSQIDTVDDSTLASWAALSPVELVSLENWAGSGSGAATLIGTSAYSTSTGSNTVGANPSGFNFSLGPPGKLYMRVGGSLVQATNHGGVHFGGSTILF